MLPTNIVRHGGGEGFQRSSWSANWGAVSLLLADAAAVGGHHCSARRIPVEFLFHVFGALVQFERSLTQERVRAGFATVRRRGRRGGRPVASDAEKMAAVIAALEGGARKAALPESECNRHCLVGAAMHFSAKLGLPHDPGDLSPSIGAAAAADGPGIFQRSSLPQHRRIARRHSQSPHRPP